MALSLLLSMRYHYQDIRDACGALALRGLGPLAVTGSYRTDRRVAIIPGACPGL